MDVVIDPPTPAGAFTAAHDRRGVLTLTMNDPATKNALSLASLAQLNHLLDGVDSSQTRAVVLTAAGSVFSAGADLREASSDAYLERSAALVAELLTRVDRLPVPVIARVNGPAFGSGLALLAASDIAIAVAGARFALPEVRFGMVGAPAAAACLRRVGETALLDLMLTGRPVDSSEAVQLGLVAAVVAEDMLDRAVEERVSAILEADAAAVSSTKRVVRALSWRTMPDTLERALSI